MAELVPGEQIDKQSPIPMYYQIMELLRRKIRDGEFAVGAALPPERELAEIFRVSRMTVRQAITALANEGVLIRRQGVGTFVAPPKIEQVLSKLTSFTEDMQQRGLHPSAKLLHFEHRAAEEKQAALLGVPEGEPLLVIERLRLADDLPMAIERTHLLVRLFPHLHREEVEHDSLYALLEKRYAIRIDRATESLEATVADAAEAALLEIDAGNPVLRRTRVTYDERQQPFELATSVYRADRYKFVIELSRR